MTRKEAIRRIKSWNLDSDDMEVLSAVVPELRESEDERMLREIKRYIKEQGNKPTGLPNGTVAVADMIAWLEKQKELPTNEEMLRTLRAEYEKGVADTIAKYEQKEQKHPDGCWSCNDYKKGYEAGRLNGFTAGYNKAMKEQKPVEWSEEDELNIGWLIAYLKGERAGEYYDEMMRESLVDWLKSLRPQPRWKHGEDEERLINTSIYFLKDFADKGYENAVECIDWLKSKLNGNTCE